MEQELDSMDLCNGVWSGGLMDAELQALTPYEFYKMLPAGIADEVAEDAWYEFSERRDRVFG